MSKVKRLDELGFAAERATVETGFIHLRGNFSEGDLELLKAAINDALQKAIREERPVFKQELFG